MKIKTAWRIFKEIDHPSKILPAFLSIATNHSRDKVIAGKDFEWSSKSWVHNIFRAYELLFWRRKGIRAEMSSFPYKGGTLYYCHTWESAFALTETKIRESLKGLVPDFSKIRVYVPRLQTINGFPTPFSPYLFAIAFDAVSSNDGGIAVTNTYSHTCTGSNLTLTTGAIFIQAPTPTGTATYNSVSMTAGVTNTLGGNQTTYIFYLASPATGANNVVTTASASARNFGGSISLSGTDTTAPVGSSGTATGSTTTPTVTITTSKANSWLVNIIYENADLASSSPTVTGTNQTSRYTLDHAAGGVSCAGSTQTTTSAGSYTSSWSKSTADAWTSTLLEIQGTITDLSISVIDTMTVAESVLKNIISNISVTDSITISESRSLIFVFSISVSDSIAVSESITVRNTLLGPINVSDSITITESRTISLILQNGIAWMKDKENLYGMNSENNFSMRDKDNPYGMLED